MLKVISVARCHVDELLIGVVPDLVDDVRVSKVPDIVFDALIGVRFEP